ncbi:ATP-binding protein [Actinomadura miaoliensis]|uniref:ATP-binding protein n=1 Tax=Actinomadura miaoliensis TaxID=430685 RepID=A0ABP7WSR6_9ACTN
MTPAPAEPYRGCAEHLADELRWLDAVLRLRTARFRRRLQAAPAAQALYISHEEIDWLLGDGAASPAGLPSDEEEFLRLEANTSEARVQERARRTAEAGCDLPLTRLTRLLGLSPFERRVVVICLAPELDRRYDKIYAYLQDDITRKRPSADLVLDLLCDDREQWRTGRALLTPQAPLLRLGILHETGDPANPSGSSGLGRFLGLDGRILGFLLGDDTLDVRLQGLARVAEPDAGPAASVHTAIEERTVRLVGHGLAQHRADRRPLVLYLHGPRGTGKHRLALRVCESLGRRLLALDVPKLLQRGAEAENLLALAAREALLGNAVVCLEDADALMTEDALAWLTAVTRLRSPLVMLTGERPHGRPRAVRGMAFHAVELPMPGPGLREPVWRESLGPYRVPDAWAAELAGRFRLTPGQIRDAVASAAREAAARGGHGFGLDDLSRAACHQSRHRLGELAVRIEPRATWADLILPDDRFAQLHEICGQVRHRHEVFDRWGFARGASRSQGVSALFSGPPGSGKTLAAEVMAAELRLELYKVDLSGVVSKYVGETEKNLASLFREAENSNAVLFFDEADALFGKRTRVSDAHDRYANIETGYLLQRMEAHDGVVILATNLRENIDEAFTRRIRFVVDFPFPDAESRRRIWAGQFPDRAPVGPDLDLDGLAHELKIAGGTIRNIVLNAAFLAAGDGRRIDRRHVGHAIRREFEKIGKRWDGLETRDDVRRR